MHPKIFLVGKDDRLQASVASSAQAAAIEWKRDFFGIKQLFFEDGPGSYYPIEQFENFMRFPIFAGYFLGNVAFELKQSGVQLTDSQMLWCVFHMNNFCMDNRIDGQLARCFADQSASFAFGLSCGDRVRPIPILPSLSKQFLHFTDGGALLANLKIFVQLHQIHSTDRELDLVVDEWNDHKEYVLKS